MTCISGRKADESVTFFSWCLCSSGERAARQLVLSGGEDAIKSDEEIKEGKGYILISEDAVIDITCSDDALQAPKSVTVEATARLTVSCGNLVNCPGVYNIADGTVTMK